MGAWEPATAVEGRDRTGWVSLEESVCWASTDGAFTLP